MKATRAAIVVFVTLGQAALPAQGMGPCRCARSESAAQAVASPRPIASACGACGCFPASPAEGNVCADSPRAVTCCDGVRPCSCPCCARRAADLPPAVDRPVPARPAGDIAVLPAAPLGRERQTKVSWVAAEDAPALGPPCRLHCLYCVWLD